MPDGFDFPDVPVVFGPDWLRLRPVSFDVHDQTQILDKSVWEVRDDAHGFVLKCIGSPGHFFLRFLWHDKAAHQALRYSFSDPSSPYAPRGPNGQSTNEAFFHPATDCDYLQFWDSMYEELKSKINVTKNIAGVGQDPTTPDENEPRVVIWRQYAQICPRTYTDILRREYGWEGPRIVPEPTLGKRKLFPTISLRAGMRLRLEHAMASDELGGNVDATRLHRGYTATGTSHFQVTRLPRSFAGTLDGTTIGPFSIAAQDNNHPVLALEPFFGHMRQAMDAPTLYLGADQVLRSPNVIGSLADVTMRPYQPRQFLRLVYPDGKTRSDEQLLGLNENGSSKLLMLPRNHVVLAAGDDALC